MRKSWVAAAVALAMVGTAAIAVAPASASKPVRVVCVEDDWEHWRTAVSPGSCSLHVRKACWCHAGFALLENLRWSHWGRHEARGTGRETFNGPISVKQRVVLYRPRWGWTPRSGETRFFSRARIKSRLGRYTLRLDVPQGGFLPSDTQRPYREYDPSGASW
jgi:hypothetical protein